MSKVLIYGFGWSGQSALSLFSVIGFDCAIVDEQLEIEMTQDVRFIAPKEILSKSFDLYLVCVMNNKVADEIATKLCKQGIHEEKIRYFQTFQYKEKMSYLLKHFFGSAEEVLEDCLKESITMPILHSKILALENAYFKDKRDRVQNLVKWGEKIRSKFLNQSIFSMLYSSSISKKYIDHISYPCFNIAPSQYKTNDKNFYFIERIDFEAIKNRPKDVKLVACFGNSALRVEYLPLEQTITSYLQKIIGDKFIVVNFGVSAYTTYEQMMLYHALVYPLKPEIVLSFFAGTDFRIAPVCCDYLMNQHDIIYTPYYYERNYKSFARSDLPLYCENGTRHEANPRVQNEKIIKAILARLEQFRTQVELAGGGGQICCFYPTLAPLQVRMEQRGERNAS